MMYAVIAVVTGGGRVSHRYGFWLTGPDSEDDWNRPFAQLGYALDYQTCVDECVKQIS